MANPGGLNQPQLFLFGAQYKSLRTEQTLDICRQPVYYGLLLNRKYNMVSLRKHGKVTESSGFAREVALVIGRFRKLFLITSLPITAVRAFASRLTYV
jgi:hypothetical protein